MLGYNIGTGSVTTMAKAGATYGMALLWTILLSCVVTYFMIFYFGRYTLVTGETALQAFRKHIHPGVGIFFLVALTLAVSGSIIGVMGIIADVLYEWSRTVMANGIGRLTWAAGISLLVFALFWQGKTDFFQRALAVMVAVMGGCFILNFFLLTPPLNEILGGLMPTIPDVPPEKGVGPFLVIASMAGTTVAPSIFIVRSILVKEAGWTLNDAKVQRRDAMISAAMMFVVSAAIMASAAGTLFVRGIGLNEASDMVVLLEPIADRFAVAIFVLGIVAAGISSQFPNVLLFPWLLCDYFESARDMTRARYRVIVFIMALLGLIVPIYQARPIFVMIASQVANALVLPATVLCILYLSNRKDVMGKHRNGPGANAIMLAILLFSFLMCGIGIKGLITSFIK